MKKALLLLTIVLYFPYIFLRFMDGKTQLFAIIIALVTAFLLAWVNIIYAVLGMKVLRTEPQKCRFVNQTLLVAKIILVPFFALNLMIWIFLSGIFLLTPGGVIVDFILIIPIALGFTYAVLLATSSYSITLLFALYKNGILSRKQLILHSVFQLIFITDVIDQLVIQKFTRIRV